MSQTQTQTQNQTETKEIKSNSESINDFDKYVISMDLKVGNIDQLLKSIISDNDNEQKALYELTTIIMEGTKLKDSDWYVIQKKCELYAETNHNASYILGFMNVNRRTHPFNFDKCKKYFEQGFNEMNSYSFFGMARLYQIHNPQQSSGHIGYDHIGAQLDNPYCQIFNIYDDSKLSNKDKMKGLKKYIKNGNAIAFWLYNMMSDDYEKIDGYVEYIDQESPILKVYRYFKNKLVKDEEIDFSDENIKREYGNYMLNMPFLTDSFIGNRDMILKRDGNIKLL